MKKAIFISSVLVLLAMSMGSCKKCYMCTLSYSGVINGQDSIVNVRSEQCNHGTNGAGANLNSAVADMEANGYTCTKE